MKYVAKILEGKNFTIKKRRYNGDFVTEVKNLNFILPLFNSVSQENKNETNSKKQSDLVVDQQVITDR